MTHVTCRLTAKIRDQLRNPMLIIECGLLLPFLLISCPVLGEAELALVVCYIPR